jgi:hypothetical protein
LEGTTEQLPGVVIVVPVTLATVAPTLVTVSTGFVEHVPPVNVMVSLIA